jgi:hypothetical protein
VKPSRALQHQLGAASRHGVGADNGYRNSTDFVITAPVITILNISLPRMRCEADAYYDTDGAGLADGFAWSRLHCPSLSLPRYCDPNVGELGP